MATLTLPYHPPLYKSTEFYQTRKFISFPLSTLPSTSTEFLDAMGDFQLVLLGEFLGRRRLPEAIMRQFIRENWRVRDVPDIIRREDEMWVFTFSTREEAIEVMENGPFEIENSLFGFARPTPDNPFPRVDFTRVPIWIEFRRIPPELMSRQNVEYLASHVGDVIRLEMRHERDWHTAYPRVYVYLNVFNPVLPSVGVGDEDDPTEVIISYRGFQPCRRCGRLGHSMGRCRASEAMVVRDLNTMLQRLQYRGGVGPITSANHALYTSANQGRGLLTNWIRYNPDPSLMTPNQGGYRAARDQARPQASHQVPNPAQSSYQRPNYLPQQALIPTTMGTSDRQNGFAHTWERRDIYSTQGPSTSTIPPVHLSSEPREGDHGFARYRGQNGSSSSGRPAADQSRDHMQIDEVMHLLNPLADEEDRQRQEAPVRRLFPEESDPTLIIYVNDSDVPEEERHQARPSTPSSVPPLNVRPVVSQASFSQAPPHGYVLYPWPMPMGFMAVPLVPFSGSVTYNGQPLMIQDMFQSLRLRESSQNSHNVPFNQGFIQPPSTSVSPRAVLPLRLSPTSGLETPSVPIIPAPDFIDDDTLAEQLVLMDQFRAHQARRESQEMRLARSVTSPPREDTIIRTVAETQEAALPPRPEVVLRRPQREASASHNPDTGERSAPIRRRGRRPGKEPIEEAGPSTRRASQSSFPPWPSILGLRAREEESDEEERHVRHRMEPEPSASSHNLPKEAQSCPWDSLCQDNENLGLELSRFRKCLDNFPP